MFLAALDPILGVVLVGVIGPILTYLVAAKKMTGEVKTSDATELWAESRSIREWSADRIAQLTGIITALEVRVNAVDETNKQLAIENDRLATEVHDLNNTISSLRIELATAVSRVEVLNAKLEVSQDRVDVLEEAADHRKEDDHAR